MPGCEYSSVKGLASRHRSWSTVWAIQVVHTHWGDYRTALSHFSGPGLSTSPTYTQWEVSPWSAWMKPANCSPLSLPHRQTPSQRGTATAPSTAHLLACTGCPHHPWQSSQAAGPVLSVVPKLHHRRCQVTKVPGAVAAPAMEFPIQTNTSIRSNWNADLYPQMTKTIVPITSANDCLTIERTWQNSYPFYVCPVAKV